MKDIQSIHSVLATCHPQLAQGQVWCRECGKTKKVDTMKCLAFGWPKCCGYTMTIDPPKEQGDE